jgi:hypothetical protein
MNRIASIALLVFGVVLLVMGWDAYRSVGSGVSRLFTGVPTDRAMLLLVGGGLLTVSGLGGLSRGGPK